MILKIPSEEVAPCYTLFCTVDTVYTVDFVYIVFYILFKLLYNS